MRKLIAFAALASSAGCAAPGFRGFAINKDAVHDPARGGTMVWGVEGCVTSGSHGNDPACIEYPGGYGANSKEGQAARATAHKNAQKLLEEQMNKQCPQGYVVQEEAVTGWTRLVPSGPAPPDSTVLVYRCK